MVGLCSSPCATGGQLARLDNGLAASTYGERMASGGQAGHEAGGSRGGRGDRVTSVGAQHRFCRGSTRCSGEANRPARAVATTHFYSPSCCHDRAADRHSTDHRAASSRHRLQLRDDSIANDSYSTGGRSAKTTRRYAASAESRGGSPRITAGTGGAASGGQSATSTARTAAGRGYATLASNASDARSSEKTRSCAAAAIRSRYRYTDCRFTPRRSATSADSATQFLGTTAGATAGA